MAEIKVAGYKFTVTKGDNTPTLSPFAKKGMKRLHKGGARKASK